MREVAHEMSLGKRMAGDHGLNFPGYVIPSAWYKTVKLPSGRPDVYAIHILAAFVEMYQPVSIHDPSAPGSVRLEKKYPGDKYVATYRTIAARFDMPIKRTREAIYRLLASGVLILELRTITVNGLTMSNIPHWDINTKILADITFPH